MRRRRLLAAFATGAIGTAAGCGYAYGGGDLRREGSIYAGGFGTTRWTLAEDRVVVANSGQIVDHERGGFHDGTSVTVTDLDGDDLWRHTHWEPSVAVAGGDPVYLLDERDRVVALAASGPDGDRSGLNRGTVTGEEQWQVAVDGAQPQLTSDDRGAYVAVGDGVAAVRDGEETWRVSLPGAVESLHVAGDTLLAATTGGVVALTPSGRERWSRSTHGTPILSTGGGRVAVHDGRTVSVTEVESDEGAWSVEDVARSAWSTVTEDRAYLAGGGRVRAFDAVTGDRVWQADVPVALAPPLVPAPEGVYGAGGRCRVVAPGEDGTRWTRELSVRDCELVGGWLDGGTVAFLFESGELRWLQRADQNPGLL